MSTSEFVLPAGMVIVPRVMTLEMENAWFDAERHDESGELNFQLAYSAMLDAAPSVNDCPNNDDFLTGLSSDFQNIIRRATKHPEDSFADLQRDMLHIQAICRNAIRKIGGAG